MGCDFVGVVGVGSYRREAALARVSLGFTGLSHFISFLLPSVTMHGFLTGRQEINAYCRVFILTAL